MLEGQCHSLAVQVHLSVDNDLSLDHLVVLEQPQAKVQIEVESALLHQLDQLGSLFFGRRRVEEYKNVVQTFFP